MIKLLPILKLQIQDVKYTILFRAKYQVSYIYMLLSLQNMYVIHCTKKSPPHELVHVTMAPEAIKWVCTHNRQRLTYLAHHRNIPFLA